MSRTTILVSVLAACLVMGSTACSKQTSPATPAATAEPSVEPSVEAAAEPDPGARIVALFEDLAIQIGVADCDRVAAHLATWTREQADTYPALAEQAAAHELPAETLQQHQERLTAAFTIIVEAAAACAEHTDAQAAFHDFDALVDRP